MRKLAIAAALALVGLTVSACYDHHHPGHDSDWHHHHDHP
jgi:hypothetical protein